ncbi:HAMP domain-containing histidine kinase [Streptomyces sp. HC44]|uniref:histidine kinase n=1 Tax=Streptomyces scabichelini TaxID=2711217 RepID=A0A6G4VKA0_9ACTN|nr:HAMP domain-containing sensor histidine kinase [Streptomyces scabichelini]NGO14592.1 HAMP domain-containing histidine kinase [Streptomyces scabichelini]
MIRRQLKGRFRRRHWRDRRHWRHWTLRARLALAATGLAALALLAANATGLVLLENYLINRVDRNLAADGSKGSGGAPPDAAAQELFAQRLGRAEDEATFLTFLAERFGGEFRIYVYSGAGNTRTGIPQAPEGPDPRLPERDALAARDGDVFTVPGESGADWRVSVHDAGESLMVTAVSLADVEETTDRLLLIDALVMTMVLALLAGVATLVVRGGLRPLTRMEATADAIAAGDFRRRVDGTDPHTEPGRLGWAMNAMLGRVEREIAARTASEQRLRRFLADASHELRTPLTSIRGFAELSRRGGDRTDALRRIEAEAARMGVLVEDLLLLARLDEQRDLEQRPVDLLELAADVVRDLHARSPERDVCLTGAMRPVVVEGDPLRLRQVLANLLANAERHTPAGARITVRVDVAAPGGLGPAVAAAGDPLPSVVPAALVEVADTGPGVPVEHAPYVFERLYRADTARSRDGRGDGGSGGGSGLGLSIVAALAGAHGGRVDLAADRPGAVFRLLLPLRNADLAVGSVEPEVITSGL